MSKISSSETWLIHVAAREARYSCDLVLVEAIVKSDDVNSTIEAGSALRDEVRRLRHIYEATKRYKLELFRNHKKMVKEAGGMQSGSIFKNIGEFEESIQ